MVDRAKDKIAKSAASIILGAGFYFTAMALSRSGDDEDKEKNKKLEAQGKPTNYRLPTGFYAAGEQARYGKNNIEKYTFPTNCMVLGGRVIPLSLLGTLGMGAALTAGAYDAFLKKAEKNGKKVKDPEDIEALDGYTLFASVTGNIILSMSAFSSLSDLQEATSPTSNSKVSDYLSQMAIKSAVLPIPYIGLFNQSVQGTRYLMGDKSAQTAIGADERAWKELGLAGIAYNRPVYNYRGKVISSPQQNTEGIAGLVGITNKWTLDPIDNYLYKELNYNPTLNKRLSDKFADLDKKGMTKEDYYDYGKKVGTEFNKVLEDNFENLKNYTHSSEEIKLLEEAGYTEKEITDDILKTKKAFVSNTQNSIENIETAKYLYKKGLISEEKYNKEISDAEDSLYKEISNITPTD